ncbi:MAG: sensor histidine kinase [Alphaproteobacteria bacterium]|nr:sensor histidine kinase [Alphaproteobacteria bacterium]
MNKIVKQSIYLTCIGFVVFASSYLLSYQFFAAQLYDTSLVQLGLYAETLKSKLFELRPLNKILSDHPTIRTALENTHNNDLLNATNKILLKNRNIAVASEVYLLDKDGLTIAASNAGSEGSFVGNNYSYRPYFIQAISGLSGQFYALGTRSNLRGYYFSEPIFKGQEIIGVLVLKVAIDKLENIIKNTDQKLMILDEFGVVFLSNQPEFLYQKTRLLTKDEQENITETRRYNDKQLGNLSMSPLNQFFRSNIVQLFDADGRENYIKASLPIAIIGWDITSLTDEKRAITPSIIIGLVAGLLSIFMYFLLVSIRSRRRLQAEQMEFKNKQAAELERRVEERSAELKQVQDDLVQTAKLAALGQMSAAISHELSQPLTSITNYIENAKLYLSKQEFNKVEQNIGYIAKLSDKMTAIIHHIKIFASKRPTEINRVSINKVIEETVWFMQSRFQRREVRLEISLPDEDVYIWANNVRIEQVVMNLISNALESMQKSTIKILNIELSYNDDLATIIIRDTGEGIDEQSIEAIFKPFYTTKEDEQGMGIGLSISRSIIEEYDGILEAFNRPSGGARFEIKLPISRD